MTARIGPSLGHGGGLLAHLVIVVVGVIAAVGNMLFLDDTPRRRQNLMAIGLVCFFSALIVFAAEA